ncbi:MAG TPA: hypothetical protein VKI64_03995, partial [Acidimicrobiales bacterium]|nr:hypothetical protein [Acidimicrobiales bacterium]
MERDARGEQRAAPQPLGDGVAGWFGGDEAGGRGAAGAGIVMPTLLRARASGRCTPPGRAPA